MNPVSSAVIFLIFAFNHLSIAQSSDIPIIIIGGGASGISAGIHSSRSGIKTLIVEEYQWLGGMLTSAGVSAFDGNHKIAGGIWKEFRDSLYRHYGGPKAVETGWVSNTLLSHPLETEYLKIWPLKKKI
jgi:glycine/D-amino acid oxidase-like deaminating enzyme